VPELFLNNVPELFLDQLWPGLVAWSILYCSDYGLTIACARLYQAGAREKIAFEGSYEITPYYQRDVNSLRSVRPRFVIALVLSLIWLSAMWWSATASWPVMYSLALGAIVGLELAIHMRHFRNLFLFRAIVGTDQVRGRIEYSRVLMLRASSFELLAFSGLFTALVLFTRSSFAAGGAVSCLLVALNHWLLARKHASRPLNPPPHPTAAGVGTGKG
jgi:hypothetical protein